MLNFFRIWMFIIGGLLGLQIFLAGYGAIASGAPAEAFELHIMNGRLIGVMSLLAILWAALARAGGKLVGFAAIAFGLVVLQSLIALISVGGTIPGQIIFGFHAVNGLIIMEIAGKTGGMAGKILKARKAAEPDSTAEAVATT